MASHREVLAGPFVRAEVADDPSAADLPRAERAIVNDSSKRRFAPTTAGVVAAVTVVLMAVLSIFFGAGACVVSSLALAVLLLSAWVSARNLIGAQVRVRTPSRVDATSDFPVGVEVRSSAPTRDVVVSLAPGGASLRPMIYLRRVTGRAAASRCDQRVMPRGRVTGFAVELRSSFPFGLFETRFRTRAEVDLLVRPRTGRLRRLDQHLRAVAPTDRRRQVDKRGDQEFRALREWRPGESRRRIGWKASARRGRIVVRDFEDPRRVRVEVVLDLRAPRSAYGSFEIAVRLAGSLVRHYHERGHVTRLVCLGGTNEVRDAVGGRGGEGTLLDLLAEVRPFAPEESTRGHDFAPFAEARPLGLDGRRLVVRCGGGRAAAVYRSADAVLDVDDPRTRAWLNADCGWRDVR